MTATGLPMSRTAKHVATAAATVSDSIKHAVIGCTPAILERLRDVVACLVEQFLSIHVPCAVAQRGARPRVRPLIPPKLPLYTLP